MGYEPYTYIPTESEEQQMIFQWAAYMEGRVPELKLLHHVPNGGYRVPATASRMKSEGVKAGVPDICLPVSMRGQCGLYIELKKRDRSNRPTRLQKWWIDALQEQGYAAYVAYGADEAIGIIKEYLEITDE